MSEKRDALAAYLQGEEKSNRKRALTVKSYKAVDGDLTDADVNSELATYAKKIEKEDAHIDFKKDARTLDCLVRGVTPIPGAYAYKDGKVLKITKQEPTDGKGTPGEVIAVDPKGEGSFTVACGEGAMRVLGVVLEGKGRMSAGDFVRGRRIAVGDMLE